MSATAPTTDINPAKDQRKQQLIDATMRCISEYGLSKTTLSRVTKAAGLSAGIANFYFSSKEQLLLETLQTLNAEFGQAIDLAFEFGDSPREVLSDVIRAHFDPTVFDPDKIAVWYAFASESRARAEYMSICDEMDAAFLRSMLETVTRLCEESGRPNLNPVAIARGLDGLIDGFWQEALFNPEAVDTEAAIALCEDYLDAFLPTDDSAGNPESPNDSLTSTPSRLQVVAHEDSFDATPSDLLAPWTYYNPELFDLEVEHLFRRQWLLAGHVSDVPAPRDYLTFDAIGERALIVRGVDNRLRAFHNVCRHRGAKLLDQHRGKCAHALSCPFHGWTYSLEGNLIGVPAESTFDGLVKADHGLVSLDLEIWMGFIFIRFAGDGPSMAEAMKPVEHLVAPYRLDEVEPLSGTQYHEVRPYNWKVIHDIDNEGYHVPIGHPSLQDLYGKDYRDELVEDIPVSTGYFNEQPGELWSVKNYRNVLPRFEHLTDEQHNLWLYVGIFPSMVLGLYPDSMEFYMSIPKTPESSLFLGGSYALPDDRREARAARFLNRRINDITDQEDEDFVRWMQEGVHSSAFPEPRLSSLESGVRHFHHLLQRQLPVAGLANCPATGTVGAVNDKLAART